MEILNLLNEVKSINARYEKVAELSGENFNIFRILKLGASENRLHSTFLAELLSPDGTHGMKDQFLKLFIKSMRLDESVLDSSTAKIQLEIHIGSVNYEQETGGRIDICITDNQNRKIIIENKIHAKDQNKQMIRYYNYDKNAQIYYLTLNGEIPHERSTSTLIPGTDFNIISYKNDITSWLELCREKAVQHAMLRECITQYINLIKYLTNQTINDNMEQEIIDLIIDNPQNLKSAFIVANNVDIACERLLHKLKNEVEVIAHELNLEYGFNVNLNRNYTGFSFTPTSWTKLSIMFQFWSYDKQLVFGLARNEIKSGALDESILNVINERLPLNGRKINGWWPYYESVSIFDNWGVSDPWIAIINGDMNSYIRENIIKIDNLFKDVVF